MQRQKETKDRHGRRHDDDLRRHRERSGRSRSRSPKQRSSNSGDPTEIKIVGWCALLPLYSYKFVGNIVMSDPLIKYRFRAAAVRIVEAENETKGHRDRSTHNGLLLTHLLYNMSKIIYIFFN